ALLQQPLAVAVVVDDEVRGEAERLDLAPQQPHASAVKGRHPGQRLGADQPLQPLAHLGCRLVREGHRQNAPRLDGARADEMRDAMRERARLARTGAGEDEQRPVAVQHCPLLHRIESAEEIRHPPPPLCRGGWRCITKLWSARARSRYRRSCPVVWYALAPIPNPIPIPDPRLDGTSSGIGVGFGIGMVWGGHCEIRATSDE